nr:Rho termination factor N-terminal domain-containing protein [Thalassoroseus pseudoceratinae]
MSTADTEDRNTVWGISLSEKPGKADSNSLGASFILDQVTTLVESIPTESHLEDMPMPSAWSKKDERQYDHIKKGAQERGKSEDRAEEIAARTVNKTRRKEGRTPNKTSSGTGNPNSKLEERTKRELYNQAKDLDIPGRSQMNKNELISAIRHHR